MQWANLDIITRRCLLENRLPIHYYEEYLVYAASALRELAKDSLMIIRAAKLPVNDYYAATLPDDFMDDINVGVPVNGLLINVPRQDSINPLRVNDADTGEFVAQPTGDNADSDTDFWGFGGGWMWYWNVDDYGEFTGGYYGAHGGTAGGYKVIRERGEVQFTGSVEGGSFVLLYISNGQTADNAAKVDYRAFSAIQAYANWKASPNAHIEMSPEGAAFYNQRRLLRAQLNDMSVVDVKNIVRRGFTATIKN